ncbi:MAG: glycerol-3-phosphate acyltransferase [Deltaproteobacteria bacterium]|nr:glycerol-3-phosphate acyltransferase [Deltaproteobacteria bacterium]
MSIIIAYLAGAVNFSILLFRILGKADPRQGFSGNPGVVNVYRQAGLPMAALVWLLDMGRAVGVALLSMQLVSVDLAPWSGLALILGNRFPCFHGFRGGKGVANYLGFTTIITPLAAAISALAWLATFALVRIPFVGSFVMVSILGAGTLLACKFDPGSAAAVLATVALIVYGHRRNISEMMSKRREANNNQG